MINDQDEEEEEEEEEEKVRRFVKGKEMVITLSKHLV